MQKNSNPTDRALVLWLGTCCLFVILMVWIGGFTRLTHSGLSITEWKPVTGVLPPLGEEEWQQEMKKYQKTPEFKQINSDISVSEFKKIYLIEYFHRLLARISGAVFLMPMMFFLVKKRLSKTVIIYLSIIMLIGLVQGFMGWYMVSSGLKDMPYVSPYRLSFHLLLALLLFSLLFWLFLSNLFINKSNDTLNSKFILILSLLVIQIFYGGLAAGLQAGLIYNTFPLMGESLIPGELLSSTPLYVDFFTNVVTVQFVHRCLAILILLYALYLAIYYRLQSVLLLNFCILIQVILGIATLILQVPVLLASMHQVFAFITFAVALYNTKFISK